MADFVQVMSQFMRLCDSYKHCNDCPVCQAGFSCDCDHQGYSKTGAEEIEHIIMAWSEEHPEPVYPTWWKYLCMIGVIPDELGDKTLGEMTVYSLMNTYIQSDIAEKLGIDPKAGGET